MYKRILVPADGSEITAKAVRTAIDLSKITGATLYTISVKEPFPYSAISEMQPVPPQEFYDAAGAHRGQSGQGGAGDAPARPVWAARRTRSRHCMPGRRSSITPNSRTAI